MNPNPALPTHLTGYRIQLFALCFLGGVCGGVTATLMSAYLPVVVKDLLGSDPDPAAMDKIGATINATYLFGMMFGGLLTGLFADRFGRKRATQTAVGCLGLFTLLTAFAPDWTAVVACRFFTGFGVGGTLLASTILVAESWTDRHRNVALGILSITIPVGIFSAGLITYFFPNWRSGFLTGIVPLAVAVVMQFSIFETEKWRKNRLDKTAVAARISIFKGEIGRDLWFGSLVYGSMLIGLWAVFSWLPTWVQTLVEGSDGQRERGLSMILFAVGGLSGGFASGWLSDRFGMRRTMLACFAATFALTFLLFKTNTGLSPLVFIEIGGIALFFGLSQGVLNGYIPKLFPTEVRSLATGFCFNIGRVFTASVVFFVGWLETALGGYGNALFTFSFVFLIGLAATFFSKEKDLLHD